MTVMFRYLSDEFCGVTLGWERSNVKPQFIAVPKILNAGRVYGIPLIYSHAFSSIARLCLGLIEYRLAMCPRLDIKVM